MHGERKWALGDKTFMKTSSCLEHVFGEKLSPTFNNRLGCLSHHESIELKLSGGVFVHFECPIMLIKNGRQFHGGVKHRGSTNGASSR